MTNDFSLKANAQPIETPQIGLLKALGQRPTVIAGAATIPKRPTVIAGAATLPKRPTIMATLPSSAIDGSILSVSWDAIGQITNVTGRGNDGVVRQLSIERIAAFAEFTAVDQSKSMQPHVISTYKFFENDKLYFTMSFTLISNMGIVGAEVYVTNAASIHANPYTFDLLSYQFWFNGEKVIVTWYKKGKEYSWHTYKLELVGTTFQYALPKPILPSIGQAFSTELQRTSYFQPFIKVIDDQESTDAQAILQSVGVNVGTLTGYQFLSLTEPAPIGASGPTSASGAAFREALSAGGKGLLKALCWGAGTAMVIWVCGGTWGAGCILNGFIWSTDAALCDFLIGNIPTGDGPSSSSAGPDQAGAQGSEADSTGPEPNETKKKEETK